jgi:hypothetical protein
MYVCDNSRCIVQGAVMIAMMPNGESRSVGLPAIVLTSHGVPRLPLQQCRQ